MKFEAKLFIGLGLFFVPVGFIYGYVTQWRELVGFPAILMTALLVLMIGFYFNLTGTHISPRPEDDLQGEVHHGSGEVGFFSPWSWWPLVVGVAGAIASIGLAIGWWIFFIGAGLAVIALIGWVFEYSRGNFAH